MASRDLDRGRAHDPGDLCASRQSQRPHPDPRPHPTQISRGWSTAALASSFDACEATVTNVRGRFAKGGLEAVLHDKVQQHRRSALSGLQTAHLIAVPDQTTLAELITRALKEGRRSQSDIWRPGLAFSRDQAGWVVESSATGPVRPFQHETVPG